MPWIRNSHFRNDACFLTCLAISVFIFKNSFLFDKFMCFSMETVSRVGIFLHALKYTGSLNVQYILHYAFAIPKLNVNNYALLDMRTINIQGYQCNSSDISSFQIARQCIWRTDFSSINQMAHAKSVTFVTKSMKHYWFLWQFWGFTIPQLGFD